MSFDRPAGIPGMLTTIEARPDTRRWWMLAVLLLSQFMGLVDVLIVSVAVPAIGADLHASGATCS